MSDIPPIVYVYPGCRWNMPPGRHKALMEAMAEHTHIYFLDSPYFNDRFTDHHKPRAEDIGDSVTIIHNAFGLRFARGGKHLGRLSAMVDGGWLRNILASRGVTEYIYWTAATNPSLLWGMDTTRLVYDCIDPCFDPASQEAFDRAEAAMARKAKLVFATAESLWERMKSINPNSFLLPNGCKEEEYHPSVLARYPRPALLNGHKGPVVGYMGTIDWRVDSKLLTEAAQALPEFTFAIVGRVNSDQEPAVATLRKLPNVVMPGAVSLEEGWAWTGAFDVGVIPFFPGPMGDGINPVKMHMYLMAGKPVVTTWIRECQRHGGDVTATRSVQEFVAAIRRAATSNSREGIQRRVEVAKFHTWRQRAKDAMDIFSQQSFLGRSREVPTLAT